MSDGWTVLLVLGGALLLWERYSTWRGFYDYGLKTDDGGENDE